MPFVVDDHGDARVAFAVAGLVHADRREAAERRRHRRFQPFGDPMGGVFRRRATRRAENRLRSSGSRRSSATRVPIRNRVWTGCPARPTTPHAAALVMPAAPPSASGASEHTRTWTHPDLEHGFGTRRRIRDPRILCNRAFDVRQSGEWAFAQAFFVIHFFGRKTEYAGTPLTPTKPTARRRTDIHENSNSASFYRGNIFPLYAFIPPLFESSAKYRRRCDLSCCHTLQSFASPCISTACPK